jgi:integrase
MSVRDLMYERPNGRWYLDLRSFGLGREALIPPGNRYATKDFDTAYVIANSRLRELTENTSSEASSDPTRWDDYAPRHLRSLLQAEGRTESTVSRQEQTLRIFRKFLKLEGLGNIELSGISTSLVTDFLNWRATHPGRKPGTRLSSQTMRNDLFTLSSILGRATDEGLIDQNPVDRVRRPKKTRDEAEWLEIDEGARVLDAAAWFDLYPSPRSIPFLAPLVGTFLLTGLRREEGFGLRVKDIDLARGLLRVRSHRDRPLKTSGSSRTVPIWPQYGQIITPHLEMRRPDGPEALLFPSPTTGGLLSDIRGSLSSLLAAAGITKEITLHSLRHTYTAVRLQTLDRGEPVSLITVMREIGHTSLKQIEETYGHVLRYRRRLPEVAYRVEGPSQGRTAPGLPETQ